MSFNPRMSIIPPNQHRAGRQKEAPELLVRLTDKEIVACVADMGIPFTVADLQKPNPLLVQKIFEWFAEELLNVTRETVEPAMRAAAEEVCGTDYGDALMPPDTRCLMGFCASLRVLLDECCVRDFGFADLYRPTYERLVKILSYLINFVRFREGQGHIVEQHAGRGSVARARAEQLYSDNQGLEEKLAAMQRRRQAAEAQVRDKMQRNDELKRRLVELQRSQKQVGARLDEARDRKKQLVDQLETRTQTRLVLRQDSAKLQPYVLQSPSTLQTVLADLSATLAANRAHLEALERRARALQTSADSFGVVTADVAACIRLLEEIGTELAREDDDNAKKSRQRDALTERGADVKEVERAETMLQKQLAKWNERTDRLRELSAAKAAEARDKMEDLKAVHRTLNEERAEKGRDMEKRRVRIEQTEKKMLDLKENIENEVHNAYDEYLKMESHIKLYITEMEQAI
ncbi:kinetochore protein nuf2 [Grosmannia clavigera kw1407]|uniref:Probable kinetochore protein NUF2 n=1 Tax=Grosmannia clavigera (strain kw1407 / UAMH 11150) TaxID=655863 RepID=F0X8F2_GROCL|nr:kinetochore protein nuf2 [Grosmannia clavigera kw1407]EFX05368.1 kinetochore protein nuf2 [Grosmannia clavigera kw1407]